MISLHVVGLLQIPLSCTDPAVRTTYPAPPPHSLVADGQASEL